MTIQLSPATIGYTRTQQAGYQPPRCSACWCRTVVVAWVLVDLPWGSEDRRPRALPKRRCTNEDCGVIQ